MLICLKRKTIKRVCHNLYEVKENYTDMVWCRNRRENVEIESDLKSCDLKQALLKVFKEDAIIYNDNGTPIAIKSIGCVLRPTPRNCFNALFDARIMLNDVMVEYGMIYDSKTILNEVRYTIRDTMGQTVAIIDCDYSNKSIEIKKVTVMNYVEKTITMYDCIYQAFNEKWEQRNCVEIINIEVKI